jgi:hypothetical protein
MFGISRLGIISGIIAGLLTLVGLTVASSGGPQQTGADNNSGLSTSRLGF